MEPLCWISVRRIGLQPEIYYLYGLLSDTHHTLQSSWSFLPPHRPFLHGEFLCPVALEEEDLVF